MSYACCTSSIGPACLHRWLPVEVVGEVKSVAYYGEGYEGLVSVPVAALYVEPGLLLSEKYPGHVVTSVVITDEHVVVETPQGTLTGPADTILSLTYTEATAAIVTSTGRAPVAA